MNIIHNLYVCFSYSLTELSKWPQLQELRLSNNYLRSLEKTVFDATSTGGSTNSNHLRTIDLSNNQLSSLHRSIFKESRHLDTLILANNTLTQLPDTLFDEVDALKVLGMVLTSSLSNRQRKPPIKEGISKNSMVGFEGLWAHIIIFEIFSDLK